MADPLFINEIIANVLNGNIRIPSFQRGFVWDADRVAHLMDSIYKGYPFGSLLFWRTKTPLTTERNLGPFSLPDNDPDYPIDYILDGQQRATSIFGVFQTALESIQGEDDSWTKIYFDLFSETTAQDSNFFYLPDDEVDPTRHFPLKILFDSPAYRNYLKSMDDSVAEQVDELYRRFTTAKIPVQTFATNDKTDVAIVFERINRLGVELDTLQLLSAWSWNENFDLQDQFHELSNELEPFGFSEVGEDNDLLLRCCAAIISGDSSPKAIVELNGEEVRQRFNEIKSGVLGAVDFLRTTFRVYSTKILPYTNIIIPLSIFFATNEDQATHPDADQQKSIKNWVWRTFFTRRYSKRLEQLNQDINEIRRLKNGEDSNLGKFNCEIDVTFFTSSQFNLRNVNAKTFVLMLASENPLNFINGGGIELGPVLRNCNKKEFHHIYPKAFLKSRGVENRLINSMVNFCVLSKADNNQLGGGPPSQYRAKMPGDEITSKILGKALCPSDIFHDEFEKFVTERSQILLSKANSLMGVTTA